MSGLKENKNKNSHYGPEVLKSPLRINEQTLRRGAENDTAATNKEQCKILWELAWRSPPPEVFDPGGEDVAGGCESSITFGIKGVKGGVYIKSCRRPLGRGGQQSEQREQRGRIKRPRIDMEDAEGLPGDRGATQCSRRSSAGASQRKTHAPKGWWNLEVVFHALQAVRRLESLSGAGRREAKTVQRVSRTRFASGTLSFQ